MTKDLRIWAIIFVLIGFIFGWIFLIKTHGNYQPSLYQSEDVVTPSCTPTPIESSPTPTQVVPTDTLLPISTPTPQTQIGSPASATNIAGSSATVSMPMAAPATGR